MLKTNDSQLEAISGYLPSSALHDGVGSIERAQYAVTLAGAVVADTWRVLRRDPGNPEDGNERNWARLSQRRIRSRYRYRSGNSMPRSRSSPPSAYLPDSARSCRRDHRRDRLDLSYSGSLLLLPGGRSRRGVASPSSFICRRTLWVVRYADLEAIGMLVGQFSPVPPALGRRAAHRPAYQKLRRRPASSVPSTSGFGTMLTRASAASALSQPGARPARLRGEPHRRRTCDGNRMLNHSALPRWCTACIAITLLPRYYVGSTSGYSLARLTPIR